MNLAYTPINIYCPIPDQALLLEWFHTHKLLDTDYWEYTEDRHVWAKVADFYIILEMFDLNCIYNEKIILIGSEHCHNIENVMKKIGIKPEFKMTNYDENPKKCIKNNFFFKKYISLN